MKKKIMKDPTCKLTRAELMGLLNSAQQRINDLTQHNVKPKHGHPHFYELLNKLADLHSTKNEGYAGYGPVLGNFDRSANIMQNYPFFPITTPRGIAMMYALKHFDNIMWNMCQGKDVTESHLDTAVYHLIAACLINDSGVPTRVYDFPQGQTQQQKVNKI